MGSPVAVLLTGDTPPYIRERCGNFDAMFVRAACLDCIPYTIFRVFDGEMPDAPAKYSAIIITGSHAMVTDNEPWSVALESWIRQAVDCGAPIFGVCYGHQLMAKALGGEVEYHRDGTETGTLEIFLTKAASRDPLAAGLPNSFHVNLSHSQTVTKLPPDTQVLAFSKHDPHQLLRYAPHAWSVQFHPEFDQAVMDVYVEYAAQSEGQELKSAATQTEDTPMGEEILERFIRRYAMR